MGSPYLFGVNYDLASAFSLYLWYAHDHTSRVSLGSVVVLGFVYASGGSSVRDKTLYQSTTFRSNIMYEDPH